MMIGQSNDVYVASDHYILVLINTVNRVIFAPPLLFLPVITCKNFHPILNLPKQQNKFLYKEN